MQVKKAYMSRAFEIETKELAKHSSTMLTKRLPNHRMTANPSSLVAEQLKA
jgi:hypothetical protein